MNVIALESSNWEFPLGDDVICSSEIVLVIMKPQYFKESKSSFDPMVTSNHSQDFTKISAEQGHDHKCEVVH